MNNLQYEARFNSKGAWQSTERPISEDELPDGVKDGIGKSKYAEWPVKSVVRIELPGDKIQYRLLVSKSDLQKKYLLFNEMGQLLKDSITL